MIEKSIREIAPDIKDLLEEKKVKLNKEINHVR